MTKGYTPHALPSDQFPSRGEHGCIPRRALPVSKASGTKVLVIQYRLAPEHPHPAAVQDAVMAYRWLLKSGFSPRNIVIAGDSAGGGLAIAALISLRDAGEALPAAAVCLSP